MANITFSLDESLHKKMKAHPEIKWTEIVRRAIKDYIRLIEEPTEISTEELRQSLDPELVKKITNMNLEDDEQFVEMSRKKGRQRAQLINKAISGDQ